MNKQSLDRRNRRRLNKLYNNLKVRSHETLFKDKSKVNQETTKVRGKIEDSNYHQMKLMN